MLLDHGVHAAPDLAQYPALLGVLESSVTKDVVHAETGELTALRAVNLPELILHPTQQTGLRGLVIEDRPAVTFCVERPLRSQFVLFQFAAAREPLHTPR